PPASLEKIRALESKLGVPVPRELCEVLEFCSGIEGGYMEQMLFDGGMEGFGLEEIFPHAIPLAADGFGNHWIIDVAPQDNESSPIFFACHDPAIILYQSPNLADFLAETWRLNIPPHESVINDVHDDKLFQVWRKNPGVVEHAAALQSTDPDLREFASSLPE